MAPAVVRIATVPGPRGSIHVAGTPSGIVAIDILAPADEFSAELERRLGRSEPGSGSDGGDAQAHLDRGVAALRAFLDGRPDAFDELPLDLADRPAWDRLVLGAVREIPWGSTASYRSVAATNGRCGPARALGGGDGLEPLSLAAPPPPANGRDGPRAGQFGRWGGGVPV